MVIERGWAIELFRNSSKENTESWGLEFEEQIKFNILNFIRTIHLNELDFIES